MASTTHLNTSFRVCLPLVGQVTGVSLSAKPQRHNAKLAMGEDMTLLKGLACTAVGQTLSSLMWLQISGQAEGTEMPLHTQMQG